jgi:hypothetical protein
MDDPDRAEMRALLDQFRELMAREVEAPLFDQEARQRIGHMIGSAVRRGGSAFSYSDGRPSQ